MIRTINYQGILQSKKTVLFWYKDRPMEQIESSEIDLCVYGNLIYDKCGTTKKKMRKMPCLSLEKLAHYLEKKLDFCLILYEDGLYMG